MPATSAGMAIITGLGEFFLSPFLVASERRDILGVAQAAAIAARHASLCDQQAIADAHHHATSALKTEEFEHWDTQFHQRLFAATRNELLVSIHGILQVIRSRNPWIEL
jgi:DNA-binding FadR family transcriptional regulator